MGREGDRHCEGDSLRAPAVDLAGRELTPRPIVSTRMTSSVGRQGVRVSRWWAAAVAVATALLAVAGWSSRTPSIDPSWSVARFEVPDLDCAVWCSAKATAAFGGMASVAVEALDARAHVLTVRYDPSITTASALLQRLRLRGFRATTLGDLEALADR